MAAPVVHIQCRVVRRQKRIARVAKNGLNEIQITDQSPRDKEPNFHRLLLTIARHFWTKYRPDQQRDERTGRIGIVVRKRQVQQAGRRIHRMFEERGERRFGNDFLVTRNRQPAVGDVERALRCSSIIRRIVQHTVADTIRGPEFVLILIAVVRQR